MVISKQTKTKSKISSGLALGVVAVVAVGAAIAVGYGVISGGFPAVTPIAVSCSETDSGQDYFAAGTTTVTYDTGSKRIEPDKCNTNITLYEWYCGKPGDPAGLLRATSYNCSNGCNNRSCLIWPSASTTPTLMPNSPPKCTDSDGGKNYFKLGVVTTNDPLSSGKIPDRCLIQRIGKGNTETIPSGVCSPTDGNCYVEEVYCDGGTPGYTYSTVFCPQGCKAGACLSQWLASASPNLNWHDISVSGNGLVWAAVADMGYLYTSTNRNNWTAITGLGKKAWTSVALSQDGTRITAVPYGGYIYVSTNSGVSWAAKGLSKSWWAVAMSSDGKYQTAVATAEPNGEYIYVSSDYGSTWTKKGVASWWHKVAMSSDGKYQTAVASTGYLAVSSDYGITWVTKDRKSWEGIAISNNGSKQVALSYPGPVVISNDYGQTWTTLYSETKQWDDVTMSGDGSLIIAVATNQPILRCINASCKFEDVGRGWTSVVVSKDGAKAAASTWGDLIYKYP